MPIYEYKHINSFCNVGKIFEIKQSIMDNQLEICPNCNEPIQKLISVTNINTPKTNSELKDLGFTKLVKRDHGVYENVTARNGESKFMLKNKPETMPNIKKIISD